MRLIIRDDPTSASSYIAHYIIGKSSYPAISLPCLTNVQTGSRHLVQHLLIPLSSVSQLDPALWEFTRSSSKNTKPATSPSKMSSHSIWYGTSHNRFELYQSPSADCICRRTNTLVFHASIPSPTIPSCTSTSFHMSMFTHATSTSSMATLQT